MNRKTEKRKRTRERAFLRLCEEQQWRCHYCKERMIHKRWCWDGHPRQATKDHVVAKARGGKNAASNIVAACRQCNSKKGSKKAENFECQLRSSSLSSTSDQQTRTQSGRLKAIHELNSCLQMKTDQSQYGSDTETKLIKL